MLQSQEKIETGYLPKPRAGAAEKIYPLKHRLSVRFKIDRLSNIPPTAIKRLVKNHMLTTGLGNVSKYETDKNAYEGLSKDITRHEFAYRFMVETEYLDQAIADLIHLLSTSPAVIGSFSIRICGTSSRIIAPSSREATQIIFLGHLVKTMEIIKDGVGRQPYHPVDISPSLQSGALAPQRLLDRLTALF